MARARDKKPPTGGKRTATAKAGARKATTRKSTKLATPKSPVRIQKSKVSIAFGSEAELRRRLEGLLALMPARARRRAADHAGEPCLDLFQSIEVVTEALAPKAFDPPEKLGDTYLTSQEREGFQTRVIREVSKRTCQIEPRDVPAGEATTHGNVVTAVRENARPKE